MGWRALGTSMAAGVNAVSDVLSVGTPAAQAENGNTHIKVYCFNQTVIHHDGDPAVLDRGRELGLTNRIDPVPA